jgi:hypothetical protein
VAMAVDGFCPQKSVLLKPQKSWTRKYQEFSHLTLANNNTFSIIIFVKKDDMSFTTNNKQKHQHLYISKLALFGLAEQ